MTEATSGSSRPAIRCFISYARDDDASLSFVDEFKSTLAHYTRANSGRQLDIFVDHDSIGWGEDWRERIRDSIDTALIFIPLVTLVYLDRPMCREEVTLFVDGAKKLGVTDLFLPVVVFGHDHITENSTDPVARLIAARNYKDLMHAVIEGTSSHTWRAALLDLSKSLVAAAEKAEARLQEIADGGGVTGVRPSEPARSSVDEPDDASPGLLELMEQINVEAPRLNELSAEFVNLMGQFSAKIVPIGAELNGADPARGRVILNRVADSIKDDAQRLGEIGTQMETATVQVDGALRSAWALAEASGHDPLKQSLRTSILGEDGSNFGELSDVAAVMNEMLSQMKGVEAMSVPMRTALRPLRKGVTSIRSAVAILQSWPDVVKGS